MGCSDKTASLPLSEQLLYWSKLAEERAIYLENHVGQMSPDEIERQCSEHIDMQEKIMEVNMLIGQNSLHPRELGAIEESQLVLHRLILHNKKICEAARNAQSLLTEQMKTMSGGQNALAGYETPATNCGTFIKKKQ